MIVGNKEVSFQHVSTWKQSDDGYTLESRGTNCIIKNGVATYTGHAACSKSDNYNKVKGRKIAFTRAIQNLDRDVRKELWEAYKKNHKYLIN